jgi:hypothetical protein
MVCLGRVPAAAGRRLSRCASRCCGSPQALLPAKLQRFVAEIENGLPSNAVAFARAWG